jgi:hypothetical protein
MAGIGGISRQGGPVLLRKKNLRSGWTQGKIIQMFEQDKLLLNLGMILGTPEGSWFSKVGYKKAGKKVFFCYQIILKLC